MCDVKNWHWSQKVILASYYGFWIHFRRSDIIIQNSQQDFTKFLLSVKIKSAGQGLLMAQFCYFPVVQFPPLWRQLAFWWRLYWFLGSSFLDKQNFPHIRFLESCFFSDTGCWEGLFFCDISCGPEITDSPNSLCFYSSAFYYSRGNNREYVVWHCAPLGIE